MKLYINMYDDDDNTYTISYNTDGKTSDEVIDDVIIPMMHNLKFHPHSIIESMYEVSKEIAETMNLDSTVEIDEEKDEWI